MDAKRVRCGDGGHQRIGWSVLLVALCCAAACERGNRYEPPPPSEVTVNQPVEQEVTTYNEFTGFTQAVETVDIRARVPGYLESIHFTPGGTVEKGQLLFVIEPDLYEAQVNQAAADLAGKEAQYRAAEEQLDITKAIFERSAGSKTDLLQKTQQRDLAKAAVDIARATLEQAQLSLSYTKIYAPFYGRIDRNRVDIGNLVGSGEATILATLVRDDPIYVYFTSSERQLLEYRELQRQNLLAAPAGQPDSAYLGLLTENGYPHPGTIDFGSNRVDRDTGTMETRAVFANADHFVLPGLFARIRVPFTHGRALLIPDIAVGADQGGRFVLTVDEHDVVQYRRVDLGALVDNGLRVVQSGVTKDDWVIVSGLQRARPGATVKPMRAALVLPSPTELVGTK